MDQQPPSESLSIDDQARLTSGRDFWTTEAVGGLPSIMMTDGPHGLRKQLGATDALGVAGSVSATCFPPAVGVAQTWSPRLAELVGGAIAQEARAQNVSIVLGPGINLKRSVRGGRNFEYFSEDPHVTAILGAAWVRGLQSRGVGASLKHFAVNSQETDRMRISADVDERTLHELYLRAFRAIVIGEDPWTVMCSYNRVNGVHAAHNHELLTTILREQWGFRGAVISDWGAVVDRIDSVSAGLDLTMPSPGPASDAAVAEAVGDGRLDADALHAAAGRVAAMVRRAQAHTPDAAESFDEHAHHDLAREVASQAIVLLRNDGDILPLSPTSDIAVIGALASQPRFQGGGSSHVNATRVDIPLDEIRSKAGADVRFAPGYRIDDSEANSDDLAAAAVELARGASTVVLFLGLADDQESEGFDRPDINLPADQLALARAVTTANERTVIVLAHGGVLDLSPLTAPAIVDGALLGQAVGSAIAGVLFGEVNPSGRLAETIPTRIQDTPDYLSFPGEAGHLTYGEGLFIGYRWYDARDLPVAFPFGHGLSYTTFDYDDLQVTVLDDVVEVSVSVTNSGHRPGREVIQVYLGRPQSGDQASSPQAPTVIAPERELKGFTDVYLNAGETARVEVRIPTDDLAYWDSRTHSFVVASGCYRVSVGASSRDLRCSADIDIVGNETAPPLTVESSILEVLANPVATQGMQALVGAMFDGTDSGEGMDIISVMGSVPVGRMVDFTSGALTREVLQGILDQANNAH